jgi:hypothetical protein
MALDFGRAVHHFCVWVGVKMPRTTQRNVNKTPNHFPHLLLPLAGLGRFARPSLVAWGLLSAAWAAPAFAVAESAPAPNEVCSIDPPLLDAAAHLRAVSLDLRGIPPEMSEYAALPPTATAVPAATVQAWLSSPQWVEQALRRHRNLLWINLAASAGRLMPTAMNLGGENGLYYRTQVAPAVRGLKVPCLDKPASYDSAGDLVFEDQADGTKREGYVLVSPYWAPTTSIKVCAWDAQDNVYSATGTYCGSSGANIDDSCSCGPNLRFCMGGGAQTVIANSFGASLEKQIASWAAEGRPYTDLFTESALWVNGPMVHYYRHQAQMPGQVRLTPLPFGLTQLPDLAYTEKDTWVKIALPSSSAGILTHPAFLLRFQTDRARATRFFNVFLCQPFQAPDGGIPVAGVSEVLEPDLQKRTGCKYCHVLLEPAAGYWGRWTNYGAGFLSAIEYPAQRSDCTTCALSGANCSADCKQFYLTKAYAPPEKAWLGWLRPYNYKQPQHWKNIEQGPKLLAMTALADNRLPRCVARSTAEWLLGRDLQAEEEGWANQLSVDFANGGYDYRALVQQVVLSDAYRRAP